MEGVNQGGTGGQFVNRVRLLLWAGAAFGLALTCLVIIVVTVTAIPLVVVWVGIPLLFAMIVTARPIADVHRRYAGALLGREIASPYLPRATGNLMRRLQRQLTDPAVWRDLVWLGVNGTAGVVLCTLAIAEAIFDLLFWWLPPGVLVRVHAHIACALLAPNDRTALAQRVQQLTDSRAQTVDTSAAELRRIERDLHDGAQARLVALGMSISLAEEQLASDPDKARTLLAEARESSRLVLAELRDLVRGIHPPVLADRGLVGAVQALALAAPILVEVDANVPARLPAPVESAAYFAVAEALTNIVKHSHATRAQLQLTHHDTGLDITVRDDGSGGADAANGTGLRGIARRLSAFDGTLEVSSPPGGPTILAMVLPCASSSPKTMPSSETA
jgi:signal transduction histidine kinase